MPETIEGFHIVRTHYQFDLAMEEDLKDIDLIDRYLSNELDEQQQQVFKTRYLNDPEFKKGS